MGEKTAVAISKCGIGKVYDDKAGKAAAGVADTAVPKAIKGGGKFEVVKSAPKGEKGFSLLPSIESLTHDAKKGALSISVKIVIAALPKNAMIAFASGKASINGVDKPSKGDIAAVAEAAAVQAAKTAAKTMTAKVKSL